MNKTDNMRLMAKLCCIMLICGASLSLAGDLKLLQEKSFTVKDWENVYVNASGADVKIQSWDKMETYVKVYGNQRAEEKLKISIEQDDGTVRVIIKKRDSFFSWFGSSINVKVDIMVPRKHNAHVETSGGDISVTDLTGVFKLFTSGGDINTLNTNGKLKVETSGGDIKLNKHKGEMNMSTSGGDVVCKEVIGDLDASTSGGDVDLDVSDGMINARTSGGDVSIVYSGVNKGFKASTSGGEVRVKLPSNFQARAHLETSGGTIHNRFNNSRSTKVTHSREEAEFNGGGNNLTLTTSGGDISVEEK
jgi:hypothetical protein